MPVANYGTAALAQMASARQKFTNEQFAQAQKEKREAEKEADRQKEMGMRSAYGAAGAGAAAGAALGPAGMLVGGGLGLLVGGAGEIGERQGNGESFGQALGHTFGRMPTANEAQQLITGIGGGILSNKLLAGKQALAASAQANQPQITAAQVATPAGSMAAKRSLAPIPDADGSHSLANYDDYFRWAHGGQ